MVEIVSFLNFLETIGVLATLIFVLTSMLGMGFSLTVQQILVPLRDRKLVIFSLAANFVLVPLLALGVLFIFPLSEGLSIGFSFLTLPQEPRLFRNLHRWQKGTLLLQSG